MLRATKQVQANSVLWLLSKKTSGGTAASGVKTFDASVVQECTTPAPVSSVPSLQLLSPLNQV
jgi:hypothetical protein